MKNALMVCAAICMMLTGCSGHLSESSSEKSSAAEIGTEDSQTVKKGIEAVSELGNGKFSCTYDEVRHDFIAELPEMTEGAPLILMLPGSGNTAEGFKNAVHFEERAVPEGYAVVYITGASDPNDATATICWNSGIGAEGNDDVGFLKGMASYLQDEYGFDKERTYAVGFSNGAFMTHRLAMEAGDMFSACVSVAGMMPYNIWEKRNEHNSIGFFQISGDKDEAVPKHSDGSARYTKNPAIEDVVGYWAASNGLALSETDEVGKGSKLEKYTGESDNIQVWCLTIKDGRHSWGDERITGIDTNSLILEFLEDMK